MYRNATRRDEIRRLYLNALSQCLKSIICLKIPIKPKVQNLLTFPLFLLSLSLFVHLSFSLSFSPLLSKSVVKLFA